MPEEKLGNAHEAVRRDFPEMYFEIYGGTSPKKIWATKSDLAKPSLSITWDNALNAYVAKVIETPDITAVGHDWDNALLKMRSVQRLCENIKKIDSALENLRLPECAR